MTARIRSLSGAVLAILTIPLIVGLLACIPVPIGDPERSSIDNDISGVWLMIDEDEIPVLTLFEPYDKRTWLLTRYGFELVDSNECEITNVEPESRAGYLEALRARGKDCIIGDETVSYKAWRKKLGDHWFMTWEPKGLIDAKRGFEPAIWYGMRVEKTGADSFTLRMINSDHEVFSEFAESKSYVRLDEEGYPRNPKTLRSARRDFEGILKKHGGNDEIYTNKDMPPMHHIRIEPDDYDLFIGNVVLESD